jgi:tetrahydromethanopterin S-methyltransferase subunit B
MLRFVLVGLGTGLIFGVMDGLINANPLARRLAEVYAPVARTGVNVLAGIAIDLVYGFAIAGVFALVAPALPGQGGLAKGLALGAGLWFFRTVMAVASAWMMHRVTPGWAGYQLAAGLVEMLVLGAMVGLLLSPG